MPPPATARGALATRGRDNETGIQSGWRTPVHKNEFIRRVAKESGMSQAAVAQVLAAAARIIGRSLAAGEKVVWTGFGTFEMRRRSERRGINPQTRQQIVIESTRTPGFTASSAFKNRVLAALDAGGEDSVTAGDERPRRRRAASDDATAQLPLVSGATIETEARLAPEAGS